MELGVRWGVSQLGSEGIDTSCVVVAEGRLSGFTYIIVDASGHGLMCKEKGVGTGGVLLVGDTRTCIHTPADPLDPSEVTADKISLLLEGSQLVYFDGRLTEAAIPVAEKAKERGIPVLVEAERLRPNLEKLINLADIIVTSKNFPQVKTALWIFKGEKRVRQDFSGEESLGGALLPMLSRFQNAKLLITTLGERGSIAVELCKSNPEEVERIALEDKLTECWEKLDSADYPRGNPDCVSKNNAPIWYGKSVTSNEFCPVLKRSPLSEETVQAAARERAKAAAMADAKPDAVESYRATNIPPFSASIRLTVATAAQISKEAIVDTTGAGDAFIAAVIYGVTHEVPLRDLLQLSGIVAACNCTEIGARSGQPTLSDIKHLYTLKEAHV